MRNINQPDSAKTKEMSVKITEMFDASDEGQLMCYAACRLICAFVEENLKITSYVVDINQPHENQN